MGSFAAWRQLHLPDEDLLLHVARRVIVVVVEPDLSPGNDLGSLAPSRAIRSKACLISQLRFMRMDPDRRVDELVLFRQLNPAIEVDRARRHCQWRRWSRRRPLARERSPLAVGVKALSFEMSVRVDEHGIPVASRQQERCPTLSATDRHSNSRGDGRLRPSSRAKLGSARAEVLPISAPGNPEQVGVIESSRRPRD